MENTIRQEEGFVDWKHVIDVGPFDHSDALKAWWRFDEGLMNGWWRLHVVFDDTYRSIPSLHRWRLKRFLYFDNTSIAIGIEEDEDEEEDEEEGEENEGEKEEKEDGEEEEEEEEKE